MTVNLSLLGGAGWQFLDNNGSPLSGGLLYTYAAGTTTPQTTYTSNAGVTANTNPIVLDSAGRIQGEIWLTQGQVYKFILKTSTGITLGTYDNVPGANDPTNIYADIYATLAASSGSSLIGFIQAGTGAVATTVQARLRQTVNVKDFGATGDGVTNDTDAINAAALYCSQNSFSLYFPSGRYGVTNLTPYSNVDYFGNGVDSQLFLIENSGNSASIFFNYGINRSTMINRVWSALNNITPGYTVTLTTAAQAANYVAGTLVYISSTTEGFSSGPNDYQPRFSFINKIISSDSATGVIVLESPIFDSMNGMRITNQNDWITGSPPPGFYADAWASHFSIHDMYIDLSTTPLTIQSQFLATNGLYRCQIYNITIDSANIIHAANGDCYSTFNNIKGTNMRTFGTSNKGLIIFEIKVGSYSSSYQNISCDSGVVASINTPIIEPGEYAQRISFDGVTLIASGLTSLTTYTIGGSGTTGDFYSFKNIYFDVAKIQAFISANPEGYGSYPVTSQIFQNCVINCPASDTTVRIASSPNSFSFNIDTVNAIQAPLFNALYISDVSNINNASIKNVTSNGNFYWQFPHPASYYGTFNLSFTDSKIKGWVLNNGQDYATSLQPWQITIRNISRFNESSLNTVSIVETSPTTVVNATGSTTVFNIAYPVWANFGWSAGDEIFFEIDGAFVGAAGAKSVVLRSTSTASNIAVINSAVASNFTIYGSLTYFGNNRIYGFVQSALSGSAFTSYDTNSTGVTNFAFSLTTNIATAPDSISFRRIRVYPRLRYSGATV